MCVRRNHAVLVPSWVDLHSNADLQWLHPVGCWCTLERKHRTSFTAFSPNLCVRCHCALASFRGVDCSSNHIFLFATTGRQAEEAQRQVQGAQRSSSQTRRECRRQPQRKGVCGGKRGNGSERGRFRLRCSSRRGVRRLRLSSRRARGVNCARMPAS